MTTPSPRSGRVRVGLSGWTYAEWRGDFYPDGLPAADRLRYASARFEVLEINASFYRTLRASTYAGFVDKSRPGTRFAVKAPKHVTHERRLADADEGVETFLRSGLLGMGEALGPILWQLPPSLRFDAGLVGRFLDRLPAQRDGVRLRHALEPRHRSWADPAAADLLRAHDVAFVTSDLAGRYPMFEQVTSELVYVRLHGHEQLTGRATPRSSCTDGRCGCTRWPPPGTTCRCTSTTPRADGRRTTGSPCCGCWPSSTGEPAQLVMSLLPNRAQAASRKTTV